MAKRLSDRVKELEAENARLMEQLKTAHTKIESYSNAADDAFLESGSKRQMESEIEKWKGLYKAKESHNKSLQEQLTAVKEAYQEASEQLEQLKEKQSESKRNPRGAGRKPTEQTAAFIRFYKLYNSGSSRKEIESIMNITDSTYFRYLKLHREGHPTIDDVVEDDIIAVRCIDDDVVIKGKVCKDSSGRLYMVYADKFSDEIVYYPGGSDELLEIIRE